MTREKIDGLGHESTIHTPLPMSEKVVKLTQKDLMEIVEQERGEIEKWQSFDAFYPLSYSNHINY